MDKELIKKAIAFGYQEGCRDSERGSQSGSDCDFEDEYLEFISTLEKQAESDSK